MMEEEMEPLSYLVADEVAQQVDGPIFPAQKRRRGKAIDWKFVKKIPSIAEAKADFSRNNLLGNEQFLGRKYTGKTSAIYINCQKVVCGCNKKWRLVSSQSTEEVVLEETSEDHSNHELFLRGGGNGLSPQQVEVTQEALTQNSRMKPLQIIHYFKDKITKDLAIDPDGVTIAPPDIVRLSSYLSYQRRKKSGAIAAINERKAAAKLAKMNDSAVDIISQPIECAVKLDLVVCSNNSCMRSKEEAAEEELQNWVKCQKERCTLQFCNNCGTESLEHALVCRL